jgi:hypothetical protein
MELPAAKVFEIFQAKGMTSLFHANSVITATQFLREGALMSRGTIAQRGMFQSAQNSDDSDKEQSVWFDVFTDSVDIHGRASQWNVYGPVLFELDLEKLKAICTGNIWITKKNPIYWRGKTHEEKWFVSEKDLADNFSVGTFEQMIVFRHGGGVLPIRGCIRGITLDDPAIDHPSKIDFLSMALGALQLAITEGGDKVSIHRRQCATACRCVAQYRADLEQTRRMFVPNVADDERPA